MRRSGPCLLSGVPGRVPGIGSKGSATQVGVPPVRTAVSLGVAGAPAIAVLGLFYVHQSDVRLEDQGCGLEGLPGLLLGHLLRYQSAQFVIDQR